MDHPESSSDMEEFPHILQILYSIEYGQNPTLFHVSKQEAISGTKLAVKTKPATFLHFNWMVKECARPKKKREFKLSIFHRQP